DAMLAHSGVDSENIFGSVFDQMRAASAEGEAFRKEQEALLAEQEEMRQGWRQSAIEVAGFGSALSQLNMTGMTGEMGLFAENTIRAGQAFDNTFRIVVTNVQAMGTSVQQATDWM